MGQQQISSARGHGTVAIVNGTNRVRATSDLADWSEAIAGSSWFTLVGAEETIYTIQALIEPDDSDNGFWQLDLDGIYTGSTVTNASYALHIYFEPTFDLPLMAPGDIQRSQIWNRAMLRIAAIVGTSGGSGGGGLGMLVDFSISTLDKSKPSLWWKLAAATGPVEWWLLQAGAPTAGDTATSDDATSRWRQVG